VHDLRAPFEAKDKAEKAAYALSDALFDDAGHQVQTVFNRWGAALESVALIGFGDFVGAQALGGIEGMGQGGDAVGIDALQLVDHIQDAAQVLYETAGLVIADGDPG
jgi:hypothetical protein